MLLENEKMVVEYGVKKIKKMFLSATDTTQLWFFSKEWQKLEDEADQDILNGKYKSFDNMDDFLNELDD